VCSQKNIVFADLDAYTVLSVDPAIGGMQMKDGVVTLPNTPGLGVDIDPAFSQQASPYLKGVKHGPSLFRGFQPHWDNGL
jgi:L-alanine-DL-glutamate epimerase-like enolase superfamily enzyme